MSENFAKLNGLAVGDTIKISNLEQSVDFEPLELTVTGIYFDTTENKYGYISAQTNPRNDILTTYETMAQYQDNIARTKLYTINTTYFLKDPDLLDEFDKEAHAKGLHKNYKVSTDELTYNKIVEPAENLANVSNIFLIGVLIVGSTILVLLSVLSIRERKYEIGVLRAMGMKKIKVMKGILYESLLIVFACLAIGISIATFTAQPVADTITNNQQQTQQNFNEPQIEFEKIQVSLTTNAVFKVVGIAVLLVIISSSAGVFYILRYEPTKILLERN